MGRRELDEALSALGVTASLLTGSERGMLDEQGYLPMPGVLGPDTTGELARRFDELLAEEGDQAGLEAHQEEGADRLAVVFNSHLWHGGTKNRTDKPRRALHSAYVLRDKNSRRYFETT